MRWCVTLCHWFLFVSSIVSWGDVSPCVTGFCLSLALSWGDVSLVFVCVSSIVSWGDVSPCVTGFCVFSIVSGNASPCVTGFCLCLYHCVMRRCVTLCHWFLFVSLALCHEVMCHHVSLALCVPSLACLVPQWGTANRATDSEILFR